MLLLVFSETENEAQRSLDGRVAVLGGLDALATATVWEVGARA